MPRREAVAVEDLDEQDILDREDAEYRLARLVKAIQEESLAEELLRAAVNDLRRAKRTLRDAVMRRRVLAASERRKSAR